MLILLVPYGIIVVLWVLLALSLRQAIRRPAGRPKLTAAVQAGLLALLLLAPVAAVWAARTEAVSWTDSSRPSESGSPGSGGLRCTTLVEDANFFIGPVQIGRTRMQAGICTDGRTVSREWGPDCQPSTSLLIMAGARICQVANSGTALAEAQVAFFIVPFSIPFWQRPGYMALTVRADQSTGGAGSAFGIAHGMLLKSEASGNRSTARFLVDRPWVLTYGYDCRSAGGGGFSLELKTDETVGTGSQGFSASGGPPGELSRTDTVRMQAPGIYHFDVTTACAWSLRVSD